MGDPKRIALIAADLVTHFEKRVEALDGKAMIVCMSRRICVDPRRGARLEAQERRRRAAGETAQGRTQGALKEEPRVEPVLRREAQEDPPRLPQPRHLHDGSHRGTHQGGSASDENRPAERHSPLRFEAERTSYFEGIISWHQQRAAKAGAAGGVRCEVDNQVSYPSLKPRPRTAPAAPAFAARC